MGVATTEFTTRKTDIPGLLVFDIVQNSLSSNKQEALLESKYKERGQ